MKQIKNQPLDEEKLRKIGFDRVTAKTLISLSSGEEKSSFEIEKETDLRQPEVSLALKKLWAMNIISVRKQIKTNRRGRPIKIYQLTVPVSEVIGKRVKEAESELKSLIENAQSLVETVSVK